MGDTVSCLCASVTRWMDSILCMSFSSMVNMCSLTRTIGKGVVVFGISWSCVVVATFAASLAVKAVSCDMSM